MRGCSDHHGYREWTAGQREIGRLRHDLPITPGDPVSKKKNTNNKESKVNLQFEKTIKTYQ